MTAEKPSPLVPKLRFPEFREDPTWVAPQLGELYAFKRTNNLSRDKLNYTTGTIRNIHYGDIHTKFKPLFRVGNERVPFVSPDALANGFDDGALCEEGDIVLADASEDIDDVGKAIEVVSLDGERVVAGTHTILATRRGRLPIVGFGGQLFQSPAVRAGIKKEAQGAKVYGISANRISAVLVPVPPTPAEQQKIVDCLGSLDDLIAAEGRKLEALRLHKKGLKQQLFPQHGETVPRLRFPEFRNKGEWEERKAGSLFANRVSKGEEGMPIYSVTMHDGMVRRDSLDRNYDDIEEAAGNKKACKNDIAYNMMRMWQGALGVAPEDCLVSPAYIVLAPKKHVVSRFFEYLFKLPASMLLLTSYSHGLTKDRLRLYYDDFARIPLRCPSEPEQQRIADCLFSLDARISAQTERLDALCLHKQGLLQQIFPSIEGE
ncbi:restriction endonuclease subunit S [Bradyrhizobium sp. NBAIM14]|uniref:restriction endonuclease subunit S n=1 Tax=Bradyrhizobium sp. NBAIM14 TaxID=2793814 RepID=UPI001CD4024F|nr:restriction endonuclease subunit S [Bradyrhizobium sp. NBAIM14]MCA1498108.1 restriction endonuclease subunit S [Bradyrhizobium sp. NBAIM14]